MTVSVALRGLVQGLGVLVIGLVMTVALPSLAAAQTVIVNSGGGTGIDTFVEDVPDAEKIELAEEAVARTTEILGLVKSQLEASRKARDVIKLNCVNEKVTAVKGLLRASESSRKSLERSLLKNNVSTAQHEYEKIIIARRKAEQMLADAESCVGEMALYSGDTEVEINVDPTVVEATASSLDDTWWDAFGDTAPDFNEIDSPEGFADEVGRSVAAGGSGGKKSENDSEVGSNVGDDFTGGSGTTTAASEQTTP